VTKKYTAKIVDYKVAIQSTLDLAKTGKLPAIFEQSSLRNDLENSLKKQEEEADKVLKAISMNYFTKGSLSRNQLVKIAFAGGAPGGIPAGIFAARGDESEEDLGIFGSFLGGLAGLTG